MLRTYRTCNSTVGFSEYDFYNKLLAGVTLLRVTPPNNLLLNSNFENPTFELYVLYVLNTYTNFHANRM